MNINAEKLVSVGSQSLADGIPCLSQTLLNLVGSLSEEFYRFLSMKNGFLAFESALHIFPASNSSLIMTLETWNSDDLWRNDYGTLAENCLFFAEDIFGGQFCIFKDKIYSFDLVRYNLPASSNYKNSKQKRHALNVFFVVY